MDTGLHTATDTTAETAAPRPALTVEAIRERLRATLAPPHRSPSSQADRVHAVLRRELLAGTISPALRLTEEGVAARFATSRTPVRDALRRLESEGHLVREPAGGALTPRIPRASTMHEIYEVRVALEDLVVRRAAGHGAGVDLAGLRELRDEWAELRQSWPQLEAQFELPEFVHADEGFHEALARLAGNATAGRHLRDVNERIRLLRIHDFTTSDRIETTIAEHLAIAQAVVAGEVEPAAARMREHVQASAGVVAQRVGAALARMFDAQDAAR